MTQQKKYKDAETIIMDQQGYYHDGYYACKHYLACPYCEIDINGRPACYCEDVHDCKQR